MQKEIDLKQILDIIKSKMILIIAVTILLALGSMLFTSFFITPKYTSSIRFCLVANTTDEQSPSISNDRTSSLYAKEMMETCLVALNTGDAYSEINEQLKTINSEYDNKEVNKDNFDIKAIGASNNFEVKITTKDPQLSYDACYAFENMAKSLIPEIGKLKLKKIDSPVFSNKPSSPSLIKNSILGALIGFVLSAATVVIIALLDNTVKKGADVARQLDILLLAEIPDIFASESSEYAYSASSSNGNNSRSRGNSHGR